MQRLEVSGAVRLIYRSLGVKGLKIASLKMKICCFYRSLLPHVNNIPANMKLRFRNRIQQVVDDFAYPPASSRFKHCPFSLQSSSPSSSSTFNRLTPNDPYMGRTAPLTSKRCILYIYSTNTGTEHFKHALYSPFFLSSKCSLFYNANLFGSCIIHILYTGCAKIKKKFRRQKVNSLSSEAVASPPAVPEDTYQNC